MSNPNVTYQGQAAAEHRPVSSAKPTDLPAMPTGIAPPGLIGLAPPDGEGLPASIQWHADIKAARRLVLTTVVAGAIAAGAVEYA